MEKFKKTAKKLLFLPSVITAVLTAVSAVSLWYIFTNNMDRHPVAYMVYLLSFYTLCVIVVAIPSQFKKYRNMVYKNRYTRLYITDRQLRIQLSLYSGTAFNLVYAVLKLLAGVHFRSVWIGGVAVYYILLFMIRFCLVANDRNSRSFDSKTEKLLSQWKSYRVAGVLMFLLNGAITALTVQMIWHGRGYSYPGFLIYAMAAYTFYRLAMAVINVVRVHKSTNPVYTAAKTMDLSIALMSLFALQTAMFSSFGGEMSLTAQCIFNCCTGGFVCISVLFMAVMMVINSNHKISHLKKTS